MTFEQLILRLETGHVGAPGSGIDDAVRTLVAEIETARRQAHDSDERLNSALALIEEQRLKIESLERRINDLENTID